MASFAEYPLTRNTSRTEYYNDHHLPTCTIECSAVSTGGRRGKGGGLSVDQSRLRLRSTSEKTDRSRYCRGLTGGFISEPSQTPRSTEPNIDHGSDEPAATNSSSAEVLNKQLRQARDFLRSPCNLPKDQLARRHTAIRDLLQTLDGRKRNNGGYDLELYEDVKTWLHLRKNPHGSVSPSVGETRPDFAVDSTEDTIILREGRGHPVEKSDSVYRANGRRSAITKAKNATLLPLQVDCPTREEAAKEKDQRIKEYRAKGSKTPRQYPELNAANVTSEDTPITAEMPDVDIDCARNAHDPEESTSDVENGRHEHFLFGETTHLQTLMSAQIERDLVEGTFIIIRDAESRAR